MSISVRSPQPSNVSPKTWTTTTPLSVRRSSTRTEDESITLKEKACRPVCRRRQWVRVGEGLVGWPHLLGEVAQGILLLNLGEVEV